jgi:hypothetical protein
MEKHVKHITGMHNGTQSPEYPRDVRTHATLGLPTSGLIAALLLGGALMPAPASAGDAKVYPGSLCQQWGSAGGDICAADGGSIDNYSSYALTVSCPIIRDNTKNTNGMPDIWIYVYRDSSTTTPLTCSFVNDDVDTGTKAYEYSAKTSVAGNTKLAISVPASIADGSYNVRCVLPGRSKVYAYRVTEYE